MNRRSFLASLATAPLSALGVAKAKALASGGAIGPTPVPVRYGENLFSPQITSYIGAPAGQKELRAFFEAHADHIASALHKAVRDGKPLS